MNKAALILPCLACLVLGPAPALANTPSGEKLERKSTPAQVDLLGIGFCLDRSERAKDSENPNMDASGANLNSAERSPPTQRGDCAFRIKSPATTVPALGVAVRLVLDILPGVLTGQLDMNAPTSEGAQHAKSG